MKFLRPILLFLLLPSLAFAQDVTQTPDNSVSTAENPASEGVINEEKPKLALFKEDQTVDVVLKTSVGDVSCTLFAGKHQAAVANFLALSSATPSADGDNKSAAKPYYSQLPFGKRELGAFVVSGMKPVEFIIPDGRCDEHPPVAGAIAMVHPWPGNAAAQFMLLARDLPIFKGMYEIFGQCSSLDVIYMLTREDAVLERVEFDLTH